MILIKRIIILFIFGLSIAFINRYLLNFWWDNYNSLIQFISYGLIYGTSFVFINEISILLYKLFKKVLYKLNNLILLILSTLLPSVIIFILSYYYFNFILPTEVPIKLKGIIFYRLLFSFMIIFIWFNIIKYIIIKYKNIN